MFLLGPVWQILQYEKEMILTWIIRKRHSSLSSSNWHLSVRGNERNIGNWYVMLQKHILTSKVTGLDFFWLLMFWCNCGIKSCKYFIFFAAIVWGHLILELEELTHLICSYHVQYDITAWLGVHSVKLESCWLTAGQKNGVETLGDHLSATLCAAVPAEKCPLTDRNLSCIVGTVSTNISVLKS